MLIKKIELETFFNLASPFHSPNVSVPFHSNKVMKDLGVGLGINSMQGREANHQQLDSFAEFSRVKNRWEKVFRHEHVTDLVKAAKSLH